MTFAVTRNGGGGTVNRVEAQNRDQNSELPGTQHASSTTGASSMIVVRKRTREVTSAKEVSGACQGISEASSLHRLASTFYFCRLCTVNTFSKFSSTSWRQ